MSRTNDKARILIVDDMRINLDILVAALGDRYSVVAALGGARALELAQREPMPDLILLDVMMPEIDGYEVCRRLKEQEHTRHIPILFLTALTDEESELKGLQLGAVDYIHKPISIPLVQARVATQLELLEARRQLAAQVEQLTDAARLRDDVEQIMRHDLKAPLTPILWLSRMLLADESLTPVQRERIETIQMAGLNVLEMLNRSLDLYKMEVGTYRYAPVALDIQAVAQRVANDLASLLAACGVTLAIDTQPRQVLADEMLCYSLLANLMKNAIEASPQGAVVSVAITPEAGKMVIRIHNLGAVPLSLRSRFFEKFATSGKEGGTGIGTYAARLMTGTMHGSIAMESSDEHGTTLTVTLPAAV